MIKITLITCTYNAEKYIERTAESILNQQYRAIEHIIIDGASHDNTVEMAQNYRSKSDASNGGHEVIIISERDNGLYDAMNKGINMATGDYLCFINAGDKLHDEHTIADIVNCIKDNGDKKDLPAVLYGDTDVVGENGQFLFRRRLTPPEHLTWKSFRQGMRVCHQAFYARTDIARQTPYNLEYKYSADIDWCIRVMKKADEKHLTLLNTHITVADHLQEGMSTINHKASLKERFRIMQKNYGLITTLIVHIWFAIRLIIK